MESLKKFKKKLLKGQVSFKASGPGNKCFSGNKYIAGYLRYHDAPMVACFKWA